MKPIVTALLVLLVVALSASAEEEPKSDGRMSVEVMPPTTATIDADVVVEEGMTEPVDCHHEPLFGGTLVPLGNEHAHVELVFDSETGIFTAYFLDGDALEPVRIRQEMFFIKVYDYDGENFALLVGKPDEETGETQGDTSVFWGGNKKLIGKLEFAGVIDMLGVSGRGFRLVDFSYPR